MNAEDHRAVPGRRSILDLAPLELDCMNALWPLGEATVREIQISLVRSRPRAYTTILTIMDRLAQKGTVARRKIGRTWMYTPSLSADDARAHAVSQVIDGFFDGSAEALAMHLSARVPAPSDGGSTGSRSSDGSSGGSSGGSGIASSPLAISNSSDVSGSSARSASE